MKKRIAAALLGLATAGGAAAAVAPAVATAAPATAFAGGHVSPYFFYHG